VKEIRNQSYSLKMARRRSNHPNPTSDQSLQTTIFLTAVIKLVIPILFVSSRRARCPSFSFHHMDITSAAGKNPASWR
jgi:hypothetical protein